MSAQPHAPWTLAGREPYGETDTRAKVIELIKKKGLEVQLILGKLETI